MHTQTPPQSPHSILPRWVLCGNGWVVVHVIVLGSFSLCYIPKIIIGISYLSLLFESLSVETVFLFRCTYFPNSFDLLMKTWERGEMALFVVLGLQDSFQAVYYALSRSKLSLLSLAGRLICAAVITVTQLQIQQSWDK